MTAPKRTNRRDPGLNGRSFTAAQSFLLSSKLYWTRRMYPALRDKYDALAAQQPAPPQSADDAARLIADTTDYRTYAWLERHLQRFKYSGRYGLQAYHDGMREELLDRLDSAELPDGLLTLDPKLEMPRYYTAVDIHQHPGGVWSDEIAGFVYERGARSTTPTMGTRHADLHDRLVMAVDEALDTAPKEVFDMACGFGKSTGPFYERYRDATVTGMDLSAPCLKLAAKMAADQQAGNVRYVQGNAFESGFEDERFDVVTSTMFLHEMPPPQIEKTIAEAARVLRPGGFMAHLDFYRLPDAFARFIHYGHGRRNNEPFMQPLAEMDLEGLLARHGFKDIRIEPYAEDDGVLDEGYRPWRFPWTLITGVKAA